MQTGEEALVKLTELELKVMRVLWELDGAATVNAVLDAWTDGEQPGYTTVLKVLQILEGKKVVRHRRKGRAYVYIARVSRDESLKGLLQRVSNEFFGGSRIALASSLIREGEFSADELAGLRKLIDHRRKEDADA